MAKHKKQNIDAMANQPEIPGVEWKSDTFRISVKDDTGESIYTNDKEPFDYPEIQAIHGAINYFGGAVELEALAVALPGEVNGKAVKNLLDALNSYEKARLSRNRYQAVVKEHTPVTEEQVSNAYARQVRSVMTTQNLTDEQAIELLQGFKLIPADFTVREFRANKSRV